MFTASHEVNSNSKKEQWNPDCFLMVWEIGGGGLKLQYSTGKEETTFDLRYHMVNKIKGLRNQDSAKIIADRIN